MLKDKQEIYFSAFALYSYYSQIDINSLVEQADIIIVSLVNKSFKYTFIGKTLDVINKDLFVYN